MLNRTLTVRVRSLAVALSQGGAVDAVDNVEARLLAHVAEELGRHRSWCPACGVRVGMSVAPASDKRMTGGLVDARGVRHDGLLHEDGCPVIA